MGDLKYDHRRAKTFKCNSIISVADTTHARLPRQATKTKEMSLSQCYTIFWNAYKLVSFVATNLGTCIKDIYNLTLIVFMHA